MRVEKINYKAALRSLNKSYNIQGVRIPPDKLNRTRILPVDD